MSGKEVKLEITITLIGGRCLATITTLQLFVVTPQHHSTSDKLLIIIFKLFSNYLHMYYVKYDHILILDLFLEKAYDHSISLVEINTQKARSKLHQLVNKLSSNPKLCSVITL